MKNVKMDFKDDLGAIHTVDTLISVRKETSDQLYRDACGFTSGKDCKSSPSSLYGCEHSPIRTQWFSVKMWGIPTFASVHFRTHKIGAQHFDEDEHFVKSNREDRPGYSGDEGRWQLVNHMMLLNAQSLISMSRRRLCRKAHPVVVALMQGIREDVRREDPGLFMHMVPDCVYRNKCHENKTCGLFAKINNLVRDSW